MEKKLIIHETDPHGCGMVIYGDEKYSYSYDDSAIGDIKTTMGFLISIGFVERDKVSIIEGDEIYDLI